jgi:hypothetical protein
MRRRFCTAFSIVIVWLAVGALPGTVRAGDGSAELALVPEGTTFVACVNLEKLRKSPFKAKVLSVLEKAWPSLATLRTAGFELAKNVNTLLFAGNATRPKQGQLVVVVSGSVPVTKLRAALARFGQTHQHSGVSYHSEKEITLVELDGKLVITESGADAERVIDVGRGEAEGLNKRRGFKRLYAGVDHSADVWLAGRVEDPSSVAPAALEELTAAAVSVDLRSGASVRVRLHAKNADAAATLETKVRQGMALLSARAEVAPILERVQIQRQKSAIGLTLDLTRKEVESLMKLAAD